MDRRNHYLARKLIQDALDRFAAPERVDHEGDAQLIVLGAILEEVGNGQNNGGLTVHVGVKTLGALVTAAASGVTAVVLTLPI